MRCRGPGLFDFRFFEAGPDRPIYEKATNLHGCATVSDFRSNLELCSPASEKFGGQLRHIVKAGAVLVAVEKLGQASEHR